MARDDRPYIEHIDRLTNALSNGPFAGTAGINPLNRMVERLRERLKDTTLPPDVRADYQAQIDRHARETALQPPATRYQDLVLAVRGFTDRSLQIAPEIILAYGRDTAGGTVRATAIALVTQDGTRRLAFQIDRPSPHGYIIIQRTPGRSDVEHFVPDQDRRAAPDRNLTLAGQGIYIGPDFPNVAPNSDIAIYTPVIVNGEIARWPDGRPRTGQLVAHFPADGNLFNDRQARLDRIYRHYRGLPPPAEKLAPHAR